MFGSNRYCDATATSRTRSRMSRHDLCQHVDTPIMCTAVCIGSLWNGLRHSYGEICPAQLHGMVACCATAGCPTPGTPKRSIENKQDKGGIQSRAKYLSDGARSLTSSRVRSPHHVPYNYFGGGGGLGRTALSPSFGAFFFLCGLEAVRRVLREGRQRRTQDRGGEPV